jgi:hypothetical protein
MVYQFMQEYRNEYTIWEMTGLLGVSCNAYYRWAQRGIVEEQSTGDKYLVELIHRIVEQHSYRYGSPRIEEALYRDYGKQVSRKNVARLMRENPRPLVVLSAAYQLSLFHH